MDVEQHKKDLENLLYLSEETQKKELARLFGEDTFLFKLKAYLTQSVNSQISYKMKDRHNNERTYFQLREKVEEDVIKNENWYSYFKDNVSVQELKDVIKNPIVDFDPRTLMLITIEACKRYIDVSEEEDVKCALLHELYLKLKLSLSSVIPFPEPTEDGFIQYLKTKQYRIDLEDCRITGNLCLFCSSTDVKSYDSQKWLCHSCGHLFRKHRARKDED
jgi:hypothetical protein